MFTDRSVDVDQADDDETAGSVNRQVVVVPTQRHLELYRLLRSNSHRDEVGRLVSWWTQPKLAASLGVSVRTLRNLLADLRQPGLDPRHPRGQPPGLRLGLVRVEATTYRDQATGRHRLGANRYVLEPGQQATLKAALTSGESGDVACLNKSTPLSLEEEGEYLGVTGVSSTEAPPGPGWFGCVSCGFRVESPTTDLAVTVELPNGQAVNSYHHHGCGGVFRELPAGPLVPGHQYPLERLDYDPPRGEVLAALAAGLGQVEVLAEWPNDQLPPRSVRRWRTVEELPRRPRRRKPKEKP